MNSEPLRILLADDDESDRLNFSEAFDELKIKTSVSTVNDGIALMAYLASESNVLPYILFLDLNMPRKNGIECLKEIRNQERLKDIIVAIYSTSASEKDINETFLSGANVYIKKPTDFGVLKKVLDTVVRAAQVYKDPPFNKANFLFKI